VRRTGVAIAVIALASGCGGEPSEESSRRDGLASASGVTSTTALSRLPTQLVGVDDGVHSLAIHRSDEPGCFTREFSEGDDPDSTVSFGAEVCMGEHPWHIRVGTGGEAGSVGWTIVVGVTKPTVERVTVTTAAGTEHERRTEPAPVDPFRVFRLRLDEDVRRLEAYDAQGNLLEGVMIPSLLRDECDWICRGQGSWAADFDAHQELQPREADPEVDALAADERLRELFEGTRFELWGHDEWRGCAGIPHGGMWTFMPDEPAAVARTEWPTIDARGRPTKLTSPEAPDLVTVDLDLDRMEVVSILPYYSSDAGPRAHREQAPLVGEACRER
jgi:hypothetical protein